MFWIIIVMITISTAVMFGTKIDFKNGLKYWLVNKMEANGK